MDRDVATILIIAGVVVAAIIVSFVAIRRTLDVQHIHTDRKLDVVRQEIGDVSDQVQGVSDQVEGVRINIDGHADTLAYSAQQDRRQHKKFRLEIFRDFKEWLQHRGNGK